MYKKIQFDLLKIGMMKDKKNKSTEKINLILPFGLDFDNFKIIQHEEKMKMFLITLIR